MNLVAEFRWMLVMCASVLIVLSGLLTNIVTRRQLRPLSRLAGEIDKLGDTDSATINERADDPVEVRILARCISQLFRSESERRDRQVEKYRRAEKALVARLKDLRMGESINRHQIGYLLTEFSSSDVKFLNEDERARWNDFETRVRTLVAKELDIASVYERMARLSKPADVGVVLDRCAHLCRSPSRLVVEKTAQALSVWVTEENLMEMVGDLVKNASKYAGGRIRAKMAVNGEFAQVSIEDNGKGYPAEDRERLTEWGYRASSDADGYGFGLAYVKYMASAYGGRLKLEDNVPHGARAVLELPLSKPDSGAGSGEKGRNVYKETVIT